jgi:hypothetical protein
MAAGWKQLDTMADKRTQTSINKLQKSSPHDKINASVVAKTVWKNSGIAV